MVESAFPDMEPLRVYGNESLPTGAYLQQVIGEKKGHFVLVQSWLPQFSNLAAAALVDASSTPLPESQPEASASQMSVKEEPPPDEPVEEQASQEPTGGRPKPLRRKKKAQQAPDAEDGPAASASAGAGVEKTNKH